MSTDEASNVQVKPSDCTHLVYQLLAFTEADCDNELYGADCPLAFYKNNCGNLVTYMITGGMAIIVTCTASTIFFINPHDFTQNGSPLNVISSSFRKFFPSISLSACYSICGRILASSPSLFCASQRKSRTAWYMKLHKGERRS